MCPPNQVGVHQLEIASETSPSKSFWGGIPPCWLVPGRNFLCGDQRVETGGWGPVLEIGETYNASEGKSGGRCGLMMCMGPEIGRPCRLASTVM